MSETAAMEELVEGLEKCVAEELAKTKLSFSKIEGQISSKMKDIEKKISSNDSNLQRQIDKLQHDMNTKLQAMEKKLNEMDKKIDINNKITETKLNDFQLRLTEIDQQLDKIPQTLGGITFQNKETTKAAFTAALAVLTEEDVHNKPTEEALAMSEDLVPVQPHLALPTPSSSTPRSTSESYIRSPQSPQLSFVVSGTPSTPQLSFYGSQFEDEEGLSQENAKLLKPFMKNFVKSDKLTRRQRAFFKYFLSTHTNDKANDIMVNNCIRKGISMGVWSKDFIPEGVPDFASYLKERIRNDRKHSTRLRLKRDQKRRFSSYLQSNMRNLSDSTQPESMEQDQNDGESD